MYSKLKLLLLSLVLLIPLGQNLAQPRSSSCPMELAGTHQHHGVHYHHQKHQHQEKHQHQGGPEAMSFGLLDDEALDFFAGNDGCSRTTLNVNYIFLYKDDGTGNWDFNNPDEYQFLIDVLNRSDNALTNFWGGGCDDEGATYSGLQVNSNIYQVSNTDAWDLDLCSANPFGDPCGSDLDFCLNPDYVTTINAVLNDIGPADINVYFGNEGDLWENHYSNGAYLNTCDRPDEDIPFWLGRFPNPFDLTQLNKSQIANFYLSYLWRLNRPECFVDDDGNPYDPQDILNWYKTDSGHTLAHEIGHTLGLTHVDCTGNIMHLGIPGGSLMRNQVAIYNRSLAVKNVRNARGDCSQHVGCAYTVPENLMLKIDLDTWIDRDIIIEPNATLTVENRLSMADGARIIVKRNGRLIVDGGTITSCGSQWRGIIVEGDGASGNQLMAGSVELMNNAVIENAATAISMNPKHIPWPALQNRQ